MHSVTAGIVALSVATYVLRQLGAALSRRHMEATDSVRTALDQVTMALFAGLVVTSALLNGSSWSGPARTVGVTVAVLLAWWRAPFIVVVLTAALVTSGLRALGLD